MPEVVIALGSGSEGRRGALKLGHFAAERWQRTDGKLPELFVGGEGLGRGAREVLGVLLHEGAHSVASARGIADASRQGRWHNARYRDLAAELGLDASAPTASPWSPPRSSAGLPRSATATAPASRRPGPDRQMGQADREVTAMLRTRDYARLGQVTWRAEVGLDDGFEPHARTVAEREFPGARSKGQVRIQIPIKPS